jgi:hypothetical protein
MDGTGNGQDVLNGRYKKYRWSGDSPDYIRISIDVEDMKRKERNRLLNRLG